MPEISRFLGIVITMYWDDHQPPHFHARYADHRIKVRLADGEIEGNFPERARGHVLEWFEMHRAELEENWDLARDRKPLKSIAGLE